MKKVELFNDHFQNFKVFKKDFYKEATEKVLKVSEPNLFVD